MSFSNFIKRIRGPRTFSESDVEVFETEKLPKQIDSNDTEKETVLIDEPIIISEDISAPLSEKIIAVFGFNQKNLSIDEHYKAIEGMTKVQLDEYAEKYDIYLDRRQTKPNMINEFIQKLKEKN